MQKVLLISFLCVVFAAPASANPVAVAFSSTAAGPFAFQADIFSLAGQSGLLMLDTASLTTANINSASFFLGDSGSFNGSEQLTLIYNLTLAGVTHALAQTATWTITPNVDTFITLAASSPVLFDTPAGSWNVTLGAYSFTGTGFDIGTTQTKLTPADFAPVPEPGTLGLVVTSLIGSIAAFRRKLFRY